MNYKNGEEFLNHLNQKMHLEEPIKHRSSISDNPEEKIKKYISALEKTHNLAKSSKHRMNLLKQFYYKKYVIKELSESYIQLIKKISSEEGYGDINVTEELKEKILFQIQEEQKLSLNNWI